MCVSRKFQLPDMLLGFRKLGLVLEESLGAQGGSPCSATDMTRSGAKNLFEKMTGHCAT
jgi:hypothetical protein